MRALAQRAAHTVTAVPAQPINARPPSSTSTRTTSGSDIPSGNARRAVQLQQPQLELRCAARRSTQLPRRPPASSAWSATTVAARRPAHVVPRRQGLQRIGLYADWDVTHRFDGQLLEREFEAQVGVNRPMRGFMPAGMTRVATGKAGCSTNICRPQRQLPPDGKLQLGAYRRAAP